MDRVHQHLGVRVLELAAGRRVLQRDPRVHEGQVGGVVDEPEQLDIVDPLVEVQHLDEDVDVGFRILLEQYEVVERGLAAGQHRRRGHDVVERQERHAVQIDVERGLGVELARERRTRPVHLHRDLGACVLQHTRSDRRGRAGELDPEAIFARLALCVSRFRWRNRRCCVKHQVERAAWRQSATSVGRVHLDLGSIWILKSFIV